jgi:hypothetical protein
MSFIFNVVFRTRKRLTYKDVAAVKMTLNLIDYYEIKFDPFLQSSISVMNIASRNRDRNSNKEI